MKNSAMNLTQEQEDALFAISNFEGKFYQDIALAFPELSEQTHKKIFALCRDFATRSKEAQETYKNLYTQLIGGESIAILEELRKAK